MEHLNKELDYNKGFLKSIEIKLWNEKIAANAKHKIIANELKKESNALSKIKTLELQISAII